MTENIDTAAPAEKAKAKRQQTIKPPRATKHHARKDDTERLYTATVGLLRGDIERIDNMAVELSCTRSEALRLIIRRGLAALDMDAQP